MHILDSLSLAARAIRQGHFANIDALMSAPRADALKCESDLESMMNSIRADRIVFPEPIDCHKWGMKLVSVEQLFPAPEEYGIQFNVVVGSTPVAIAGWEAPAFLYQAAYHATEAIVIKEQCTRFLTKVG